MGTFSSAVITDYWEHEHVHPVLTEEGRRQPALIVPGLNNSDANHWQTRWLQEFTHAQRITLQDWHIADLDKWRNSIQPSLLNASEPVVLIAHSFGALAAVSIAVDFPDKVAGLFLVAPADPEKFGITERLPQKPLRIPGLLIASSNDPWMEESKAAYLALLWGVNFLRLKGLGHINSQSDIGVWPEGLVQYQKLMNRIESNRIEMTRHSNPITNFNK